MGPSGKEEVSLARPKETARRPGRLGRLLTISAIVLVVIVGGYGTYAFLSRPAAASTLVVYTYSSFLGGNCGGANVSAILAPFEAQHHVHIDLECPAGTLASTLIAEKNAPQADVVAGLDEVTAPQAEAAGVLIPYASPALAYVPVALRGEISPDSAVTPYEWGYLGLDYCPTFSAATAGAVDRFQFPALAANQSWAHNFIVEDPAVDIVGEEFLLWQIQFYTQVLHQDWRPFWSAVAPNMTTVASWDSGYSAFSSCTPGSPELFASYLADPAAAAYYGSPGSLNSSVSWWNGTAYGWKTVYGVGVVRGSSHVALDEAFIDWMLSPAVQASLPTTEWEYPANATVGVPSVYSYAPESSTVVALNDGVSPATIGADLPTWVEQWQLTVNAAG